MKRTSFFETLLPINSKKSTENINGKQNLSKYIHITVHFKFTSELDHFYLSNCSGTHDFLKRHYNTERRDCS